MFLSVVGPGIITANADNDVGGILTYSQAGAQFGYSLLWLLVPVTIALVVVQEMCARMGAITGKGLADLIRENFGVKVTFWCLLLFVLGDVGNTADRVRRRCVLRADLRQLSARLNAEAFKIALVAGAAIFVFLTVTRGTPRSSSASFSPSASSTSPTSSARSWCIPIGATSSIRPSFRTFKPPKPMC